MIAFPEMLVEPAQKAGIPVPTKAEIDEYHTFDAEKYPLFQLFCLAQLGRSLPSPTSHWSNAFVIASVPPGMVKKITMKQLEKRGFE